LEALASDGEKIVLRGSLLACWPVPRLVDGSWFLDLLKTLPANSGPKSTMEAFATAVKTDTSDAGESRGSL
jgi:hypothetical protein